MTIAGRQSLQNAPFFRNLRHFDFSSLWFYSEQRSKSKINMIIGEYQTEWCASTKSFSIFLLSFVLFPFQDSSLLSIFVWIYLNKDHGRSLNYLSALASCRYLWRRHIGVQESIVNKSCHLRMIDIFLCRADICRSLWLGTGLYMRSSGIQNINFRQLLSDHIRIIRWWVGCWAGTLFVFNCMLIYYLRW